MESKTLIIGTKFYGHDSSLFIIFPHMRRVCAMQTERLTRYKHDRVPPIALLDHLLKREGVDAASIERVICCNSFGGITLRMLPGNFYTTEMLYRRHFKAAYKREFEAAHKQFEKLSYLGKFFDLLGSFSGWLIVLHKVALAVGLVKYKTIGELEREWLSKTFPRAAIDIRAYDHEYCHAVCSYVTSPFEEATLLTFDGWGDKHFSHAYAAKGGKLTLVARSPRQFVERVNVGTPKDPHTFLASVGGIYSYFTEMLGFVPEEDEGKVEALAAYGKPLPQLAQALRSLVSFEDDLSLSLNVPEAARALALPAIKNLIATESKEDISATVQAFLEEVTMRYVPALLQKTGIRSLALSGGVAANVINNLRIYEEITPELHVTPAMADDGSAQGAAYACLLGEGVDIGWLRALVMPYYETSYDRSEVKETLDKNKELVIEDLGDTWPERVATLLADGKIGAIYQGRAEWGPRALGNRSIIADARRKDARDRLNAQIKKRPHFHPFCPSILAEEKDRLFEKAYLNKHMSCAFRLKKELWGALPGAIHIDGTARAQFVEESDNPMYWKLLKKVKELSGYGVIINTSFNKHGRTIVESPKDAVRDFLDTDMDYLLIEGFLVTRAHA